MMGYLHYETDEAMVVSNNSYTTSAQQLACKLGVKLLHYSELESLDEENQAEKELDVSESTFVRHVLQSSGLVITN